jgi:hypothetical protein
LSYQLLLLQKGLKCTEKVSLCSEPQKCSYILLQVKIYVDFPNKWRILPEANNSMSIICYNYSTFAIFVGSEHQAISEQVFVKVSNNYHQNFLRYPFHNTAGWPKNVLPPGPRISLIGPVRTYIRLWLSKNQRPRKHFESGGALAKRGTFVYDQNQTILCRSRAERKFLKIWSLYDVGNGLYRVFTAAKKALSFQQKRAFIQEIIFFVL